MNELANFEKPTLEEVESYAKAKGYDKLNAEKFFNDHERRGWLSRKGSPIDWRTAVRHEGHKMKMLLSR
jgi:hypothetical protein